MAEIALSLKALSQSTLLQDTIASLSTNADGLGACLGHSLTE